MTEPETRSPSPTPWTVAAIALVALAAALPLVLFGITSGPDLPQHFQFAHTVRQTIADGNLYPSFSIDQNRGLGDVGLRFYPPLTYYALAGLNSITGNWFTAVVAAYLLIMFAGGIGIYFWAREYLSERHALMSAAFFILAPYHLSQFFQSFLLAEFTASAIVPFCFLFVTRISKRGSVSDIAGLAATYSLLILTHLPSTIIVSICLAIYGILMVDTRRTVKYFASLAAAVTLAVTASSFYWIRMVAELPWVKHSKAEYFMGSFDFRSNFLFGFQYILGSEEDGRSLWFADLMLAATIIIALPAVFYLIKGKLAHRRFVVSMTAVMFVGILMSTPLSTPIWNAASFLQKVQFPWRWISVITPFAAILGAIGTIQIADTGGRDSITPAKFALMAILAIFVFTTSFLVKGAVFMPRHDFEKVMTSLADSRSYIAWWPLWANESAFEVTDQVASGDRAVTIREFDGIDKQFSVVDGIPTTAVVRIFYYPHWKASVNGSVIETQPNKDGLISFELPAGPADVRVFFQEPARSLIAAYVALTAWLMIAAMLFWKLTRRRIAAKSQTQNYAKRDRDQRA